MITQTQLMYTLGATNVVFLIITIFLFIRCRKLGKQCTPRKKENPGLKGIADITPEEFKPERIDVRSQDVIPVKTRAKPSKSGLKARVAAQEQAGLKLEDELPEVEKAPRKKVSKKRKPAKKEPEPVVKGVAEPGTGTAPGIEPAVAPGRKTAKKKKPVEKEPEIVAEEVIKELTEIAPEKKTIKKKKLVKKEPEPIMKEVIEPETAVAPEMIEDENIAASEASEEVAGGIQVNKPE